MLDLGKNDISLFVETAGKCGQLGSLGDILSICKAVPCVFPCVDFGHVHARTRGNLETQEGIDSVFAELSVNGYLGGQGRVHFHYTPIAFGPRGELSHKAIHDRIPESSQLDLPTLGLLDKSRGDSFYHPRYEAVACALRQYKPDCTVISETNNSQEEGAQMLRAAFLSKE